MSHFQFAAMMNEAAENTLVYVLWLNMDPFLLFEYRGEGSLGHRIDTCSSLIDASFPQWPYLLPLPPAMREGAGGFVKL